jgi:hypothetical protein
VAPLEALDQQGARRVKQRLSAKAESEFVVRGANNHRRHSGARVSASPVSIGPQALVGEWIPGSMLRFAPE